MNQTPLINEENLYCRINTNGLLFSSQTGVYGKEFTHTHIADVVAYGNDVFTTFNIILSPSDLQMANHIISVSLSFGGKYSPVRFCQYEFELVPPMPKDLKNKMTVIPENVYLHELHEKKAKKETKEELLSRIGR
jgi:hypothetical protein